MQPPRVIEARLPRLPACWLRSDGRRSDVVLNSATDEKRDYDEEYDPTTDDDRLGHSPNPWKGGPYCLEPVRYRFKPVLYVEEDVSHGNGFLQPNNHSHIAMHAASAPGTANASSALFHQDFRGPLSTAGSFPVILVAMAFSMFRRPGPQYSEVYSAKKAPTTRATRARTSIGVSLPNGKLAHHRASQKGPLSRMRRHRRRDCRGQPSKRRRAHYQGS